MFFEYPLNYEAKEKGIETNENALLLSNGDLSTRVGLSGASSSIVFTLGTVMSPIALSETYLYILTDNVMQITLPGGDLIKKTRSGNDRTPTIKEIFFQEFNGIDYSLINAGSVGNTFTLQLSHGTGAAVFEVYLIRYLGELSKIEDVRYNPPENRNEYTRQGFYGTLSKQRISNIHSKRSAHFVARGNRVQMEALTSYADKARLTFVANAQLEPALVFPALIELTGPRQHVAQWQSDLFRMPYTVREI